MWEQEPWLFSYHSPCTWQTAQHRTGTQKPASESVCKTSSYSMSLTAFCHRLTNYNYISFRSYALPMGLTKSSCQVSPWFVSQDFPGKVSLLSLLQCPLTGSPLALYLCQAKGAAWVVQFSRQQHSLGSALSRDQTLSSPFHCVVQATMQIKMEFLNIFSQGQLWMWSSTKLQTYLKHKGMLLLLLLFL